MKTLLWAVAVLAIEVLLVWGYFAVVGEGRMFSANVALALLVGTGSVMVWLGFVSGFEQTWRRLLLTIYRVHCRNVCGAGGGGPCRPSHRSSL